MELPAGAARRAASVPALTTLHLVKEREAAELLGIPADVTQVALLPVAYTLGDDFRPAARAPVETITAWDRWGNVGRCSGLRWSSRSTRTRDGSGASCTRARLRRRASAVVDHPGGRITILAEGDEAQQGLVRTCEFPVPRYLLSGGCGESWEVIVEARLGELSRYQAVGRPAFSPAPRAGIGSSCSRATGPG